jgi:hypothetical protein
MAFDNLISAISIFCSKTLKDSYSKSTTGVNNTGGHLTTGVVDINGIYRWCQRHLEVDHVVPSNIRLPVLHT